MPEIIYQNGQQCYPVNGQYYPRITSILDIYYRKLYGNPPPKMREFMNQRAAIGTAVHALIDLYVHGLKIQDEHKNHLNGEPYRYFQQSIPTIEEWLKNGHIKHSEIRVISHKFRIAGTADLIIQDPTVPNTYRIVDFKTSTKPKTDKALKGYFLQLAAYALAAKETLGITINGGTILFLLLDESRILEIDSAKILEYATEYIQLRNEYFLLHRL